MLDETTKNAPVCQCAAAGAVRWASVLVSLALGAPVAAFAADQFDGSYAGQRTLLRGAPPSCRSEGVTILRVRNGHVSLTYASNTFDAEVGADGSFEKTQLFVARRNTVSATLKGRITNNTLMADLETYACKYHYVLTRK